MLLRCGRPTLLACPNYTTLRGSFPSDLYDRSDGDSRLWPDGAVSDSSLEELRQTGGARNLRNEFAKETPHQNNARK
jgi:hypothetical protein